MNTPPMTRITFVFVVLLSLIVYYCHSGVIDKDELPLESTKQLSNKDTVISGTVQKNIAITNSDDGEAIIIQYKEIEQGKLSKYGNSFIKYAAVMKGEEGGQEEHVITVQRWFELMASSISEYQQQYATILTNIIKSCPFDAVFFETKGVTISNVDTKPFEFVLVDAPRLYNFANNKPNADAFRNQLEEFSCVTTATTTTDSPKPAAGCVFANLGGDAILVAPRWWSGQEDLGAYSHLAAFVRKAPESQVIDFWRIATSAFLERLQSKKQQDDTKPIWFSTAGMGIAWLHVRLDDRPKYYRYQPFTNEQ